MLPRSLPAAARQLQRLPLAQLVATAGDLLPQARGPAAGARPFTAWTTFWLFLGQVLAGAGVCRDAVCAAQAWLGAGRRLSSSSSAYCQARARLPLRWVRRAAQDVVDGLGRAVEPSWRGRIVRGLDGSSISMPDTPANQRRYPQPGRQRAGCGFPVMRIAAVFCLASGALRGLAHGPLSVPERTLGRRLWRWLEKGCVLLADRGFCGFADYWALRQRGVDAVMRLHQRRSVGVKKIQRLAKNDWLVEWANTADRPQWMTRRQWNALPSVLRLRHIALHVDIRGFRTQSITVATTLLDAKAYPAQAVAELYRCRWNVELCLRDIKITMGMDPLRCKSPAMVHKELLMHWIAYNLVRALMLEAARRHHADPRRLSLAGSRAAIEAWAPRLAAARSQRLRQRTLADLLWRIAHDPIPHPPKRAEPPAPQPRPKKKPMLKKTRSQ
ncbi:MAG: IS4 family transposase, partial [Candidatus Sumerlaeota bacterium]|nr:IS4 family transposase [Candidatus Sumerlaeota bacterium]